MCIVYGDFLFQNYFTLQQLTFIIQIKGFLLLMKKCVEAPMTSQNDEEIPMITNEENKSGIVAATFTNSPKIFWLLYYRGNLHELKNLQADQKLYRRLLQKTTFQRFQILQETVSTKLLRIINTSDNAMVCSKPEISPIRNCN